MPGEIAAGRDVGFGAVLPGSGVRHLLEALPAGAHQLPGWDAASGREGQDLPR